jgi:hypothetical protein
MVQWWRTRRSNYFSDITARLDGCIWVSDTSQRVVKSEGSIHSRPGVLCFPSMTSVRSTSDETRFMSFVEHLLTARENIKPSDPWIQTLRTIKGQIGCDGIERIATEAVFEHLGVPPFQRTPAAAKRLRGLMVQLGWTPVRARAVTARGRAARVRGYARMRVPVEPDTIEP